jgi:hypothetical protein
MTTCTEHSDPDHTHGPDCGHAAVDHDDHVDYIHDGHRHAAHAGHWDEHQTDEPKRRVRAL